MDVREYERIKKRVDELERESAKAVGARDQLLEQLKEEFGCKSLKDAKSLAVKMRKELDEAEQVYENELARFKEKWKEVLT